MVTSPRTIKMALHSSWQARAQWVAAHAVWKALKKAGFQTYFAGGCVRDLILGREPHDFDIASDASPEDIERLFSKTIAVGRAFGVMKVLENGQEVEVARFREEKDYKDGRRPETVDFSGPEKDAARRDFTINGLFWDAETEEVLDYVGGLADLDLQILRAIGSPEERFLEDHLRLLRALRFQSQLGFEIEEKTAADLWKNFDLVLKVSRERFREEFGKLIHGAYSLETLRLMNEKDVLIRIFPGCQFATNTLQEVTSWNDFWLWCWSSGTTQESLRNNWRSLRPSNEWLQNLEAFFEPFFRGADFMQRPIGELVEKSFHSQFNEGLQIWSLLQTAAVQERVGQIQELLEYWQGSAPTPLLSGQDLASFLSGPAMGECLRLISQLQLERKLTTREQALLLAKQKFVR